MRESLRNAALGIAALLLIVALAGCAGNKEEPSPTTTPPTTPTTPSTTSPTTTSPTATPDPKQVFNNTANPFRFQATGNSPSQATMTVDAGGRLLDIHITAKARDPNTPTSLGDSSPVNPKKANITFQPPSGAATVHEFEVYTAATYGDAGHVLETNEIHLDDPGAGSWQVRIAGPGANVDIAVVVVETFA